MAAPTAAADFGGTDRGIRRVRGSALDSAEKEAEIHLTEARAAKAQAIQQQTELLKELMVERARNMTAEITAASAL